MAADDYEKDDAWDWRSSRDRKENGIYIRIGEEKKDRIQTAVRIHEQNRIYSQSQFCIYPYDRFSSCYNKKQLCHLGIFRYIKI